MDDLDAHEKTQMALMGALTFDGVKKAIQKHAPRQGTGHGMMGLGACLNGKGWNLELLGRNLRTLGTIFCVLTGWGCVNPTQKMGKRGV